MSCCGSSQASIRSEAPGSSTAPVRHWEARSAEFEYLGSGHLTVTGPLTGTVYHFMGAGARQRVNGPDVPSLVSVPALRIVG